MVREDQRRSARESAGASPEETLRARGKLTVT
nr:MAG TPA: hypothetical protein [Caudoviricetes sp.]